MRAAYISDDFYICLSNKDLDLLKEKTIIKGFLVGHEIIWYFFITVLDKEKENTRIMMSKKDRKFNLLLNKSDFENLFNNKETLFRTSSAKVYFYTQKHDLKSFNNKSLEINKLAFEAKSNQLFYKPYFDFRTNIFSTATE